MHHNKTMLRQPWDKGFILWLSLLLVCFSLPSQALNSDAQQEINIRSDRASLDRKVGTMTYQGHVIMTQGSLRIQANQIVLFTRDDNQLTKAVASGRPAHFQQQAAPSQGQTIAEATTITYLTADNTITLQEQAILIQQGNEFHGNEIVYNIEHDRVDASGQSSSLAPQPDESPNGRVQIIIQPLPTQPPNENKGNP